jgi:hypothetical protein
MKPLSVLVAVILAAPLFAQAQQHPRDREIPDPDTLAWWHTTEALSNDSMEGRDTGSAAYQRAADYVASRFKASGLEPAGNALGLINVDDPYFTIEPPRWPFAYPTSSFAATH